MQVLIDFTLWCLKRKKVIITSEIIVLIIAFICVFYIIKPQYSSSVSFFLPNENNGNTISGLVSGITGLNLPTGTNIDPLQIEILYKTTDFRKNFIEYMNLQKRYKLQKSKNPLVQTMKILDKNLKFEIVEKGSIASTTAISYKITYFDTNADSAFIGINYIYTRLDSTIRKLSVTRALEEQEYFFEKLKETTQKYDSLKLEFIKFQKENNLFAIETQKNATIGVYTNLLSDKIALMIKYDETAASYGKNSSAAIQLKQKISSIDNIIASLPLDQNEFLLKSFGGTLDVMNKYYEFIRKIEIANSLNLFMIKQHEETHLRASNDLKSLQLIDPAIKPVYKSRPKRIVLLAGGIIIYNIALFCVLGVIYSYSIVRKKEFFYEIIKAIR